MTKSTLKFSAGVLAFVLGIGLSASSSIAAATYESVNVNGTSQTLSNGNEVTIADDNDSFWYGPTFHDHAVYKTDGTENGSFVQFRFSIPVKKVIVYYAYLGLGDELEVATNLGTVDFTQEGIVTAHNGAIVSGQSAANLLVNGIIQSANGSDASGAIELNFPSEVERVNIAAAPSGTPGGQPGINLVGLDVATADVPDPTPTEEPTPTETLADTGVDSTTTLAIALLFVAVGGALMLKSRRS
ncbi:MAG: hypothetical protein ACKOFA_04125 [Rhodoluna sp.]